MRNVSCRQNEKGGYCLVAQPAPLARTLVSEFPEVELAGRLNLTVRHGAGSNEVRVEGETMNSHEEGFAFADQSILDIFDVPIIYGDPAHALDEPNSIVISKSKARNNRLLWSMKKSSPNNLFNKKEKSTPSKESAEETKKENNTSGTKNIPREIQNNFLCISI